MMNFDRSRKLRLERQAIDREAHRAPSGCISFACLLRHLRQASVVVTSGDFLVLAGRGHLSSRYAKLSGVEDLVSVLVSGLYCTSARLRLVGFGETLIGFRQGLAEP
jgi:hypothetical protein